MRAKVNLVPPCTCLVHDLAPSTGVKHGNTLQQVTSRDGDVDEGLRRMGMGSSRRLGHFFTSPVTKLRQAEFVVTQGRLVQGDSGEFGGERLLLYGVSRASFFGCAPLT